MDGIRQEMIFNAQERVAIGGHIYLGAYSAIRVDQLAGLLGALGEYVIRVGPTYIPDGLHDPGLIEAHRKLVQFRREPHLSVDARLCPGGIWHESWRLAAIEDCIFNLQERERLGVYKYIRGHEGITREALLELLLALGQYSSHAHEMKLLPPGLHELTGVTRLIHAHNALLAFRDRPFTLDELCDSVHEVLSGRASLLTRGGER